MNNLSDAALPALITLAGTVIAILIGYRQWRLQNLVTHQAKFLEERRIVYEELWAQLTRLNRIERGELPDHANEWSRHYSQLKEFILHKALFIDASDRDLVLWCVTYHARAAILIWQIGDDKMIADWRSSDIQFSIEPPLLHASLGLRASVGLLEVFAATMYLATPSEVTDLGKELAANPRLTSFIVSGSVVVGLIVMILNPNVRGEQALKTFSEKLLVIVRKKRLMYLWLKYQRTRARLVTKFRLVLKDA